MTDGDAPATLVVQGDVEAALVRPLTSAEAAYIGALIEQAEDALRTRLPSLDDRMAAYTLGTPAPFGISPTAAKRVLAGMIKRKLSNVEGAASMSRSDGPFSTSIGFAYRGQVVGGGTPGELQCTDGDLDSLTSATTALGGTIWASAPDPCLPGGYWPDGYWPGGGAA